jgi:hypothetical protein
MSTPKPGWLQSHRVAGAILTGFGVASFWMAQAYPRGTADEPGPAYYPLVVAALLMLFGTLVVVFDGPSARVRLAEFWERGRPLAMLALLAAAALLVERIGFRITLMLLLFILLAVVERVNLLIALAITAVLPLGAFALLHNVLKLNLPTGPFGF